VKQPRLNGLLVLFTLLTLVRGMLYAALVPPWQGPDEPKHFEYVRTLHEKRRPVGWADIDLVLESEIIGSMDRYRFWEMGIYENSAGKNFDEVFGQGAHNLEQPLLGFLPYAVILDLFPIKDTALQLYVMRLVASFIGVLITVTSFFTVAEIFPGNWPFIVGTMTFIVFLPMHSFMLGMLNSDHLAELFSSLVLFLLVRILHRGVTLGRTIAVVICTFLALFAKRTSLVTIPIILISIPLYLWRRQVKIRLNWARVGIVLGGLGLVGGLAILLQGRELFDRVLAALAKLAMDVYTYYLFLPSKEFPFNYDRSFFGPEAFSVYQRIYVWLYRSFWGWFGWLRAPLSPWLYTLLGLISIAALFGLLLLVARARQGRLDLALQQRKTLILFAMSFVFTLLIITAREIRNWEHWGGGYPHGRFLFPVLIPIATLFFLGLSACVPIRYRKRFTLGYVLAFVLFDAYAVIRYALPFFYYR